MSEYLHTHLDKKISFKKPEGGLAYWVKINRDINTEELAAKLLKKGVSIIPTERFSFNGKPLNALRLGYASLTPAELEEGIRLLATVLKKS